MVKWKADLITGITLLIFSVGSFFYTYTMDIGSVTKIASATPGFYVRMWVIVVAILSLVLIISAYRHREVEDKYPIIWNRLGIITIISLTIYLLLMPYLGFNIMTAAFVFALIHSYSIKMGKYRESDNSRKLLLINIISSVGVTLICNQLFSQLLQVMLPEFILF